MEHGVAVGVVGPRFAGAAGEDAVVGVVGVAGERGGGGGGLTCPALAQAVAEAVVAQAVDDFTAFVITPAEHAPGGVVAVAAGLGGGAACRGVAIYLIASYARFTGAVGLFDARRLIRAIVRLAGLRESKNYLPLLRCE